MIGRGTKMTSEPSAPSASPPSTGGSTRAVASLAIVAGLVWGLFLGASAFGCEFGGSWEPGSRAAPAAALWLALCVFGVALWRRSHWTLLLAPVPFVLGAAVIVAAWLEPQVFGLAGCVVGLEGIGPYAPWMAPSLIPSFEVAAIVFAAFTVVVPGVGVARLLRVDPGALDGARELLPSRRVVKWVAAVTLAASLVALLVQRLRPLPLDASFDEHSASLPAADQVAPPDLGGLLQILNVRSSRLHRGILLWIGPLLETRLGPVTWTSDALGWGETRLVTATADFPPSLWRPPFDARARPFEQCLDALRGNPKDDAFIKDWSDWWSGKVPGEEISRKWGPHDPEIYRQEISEFERGLITAQELDRRWAARASLGPEAELYNGLVRCAQRHPKIAAEAFSRVALQWRCAWLQCRWVYIDPDAWERVTPRPCRDAGPRRCVEEAFTYLATGGF